MDITQKKLPILLILLMVLTIPLSVEARIRNRIHVDEIPGLERAAFSTQVYSDVPIVAERAIYFVKSCGY